MPSPSPLSEADRYLLDLVRRGDAEGWSQLVDRYRGRLLAFAEGRLANRADAEDLVQDAFVHFLRGLPNFRGEAGLETYLFTILRRRIIDSFRGRRIHACRLRDTSPPDGERDASGGAGPLASSEPTASWYARRDEAYQTHFDALTDALRELLEDLKESQNFQALQIAEALFYAQLRNKEAARLTGASENQVALNKHRWLKRIQHRVRRRLTADSSGGVSSAGALWQSPEGIDTLLTDVWEHHRLSCPKRSTIGRYLLETLDPPWSDYVHFHVEQLGCRFCRANLADLRRETAADPPAAFQDRILKSTIGFFRQSR